MADEVPPPLHELPVEQPRAAPPPRPQPRPMAQHPAPPAPQPHPLPAHHRARAAASRKKLLGQITPGAADEELLVDLTADAAVFIWAIEESQAALAQALLLSMSDPKRALHIASTLQRTVEMGNSLCKRVEGSLALAATLRAQRRLERSGSRDDT